MRALRAGLRELPQHKLGPDFAAEVLRRAERELALSKGIESDHAQSTTPLVESLGASACRPQPPAGDGSPQDDGKVATVSLSRILKNPRGIGWSLVAIAVALMILVTNRGGDRNQQTDAPVGERTVARAPQTAANPTQEEIAAHSEVRNKVGAGGQSVKDQPPLSTAAEPLADSKSEAGKLTTQDLQKRSTVDQPSNAPAAQRTVAESVCR